MTVRQRPLKKRSLGVWGLFMPITLLSSLVSANEPVYYDSPLLTPQIPLDEPEPPSLSDTHEFTLRHIFHRGTYEHPDLHRRLDIKPDTQLWTVSEDGIEKEPYTYGRSFVASSHPLTIQRLADRRLSVIDEHLAAARTGNTVSAQSSEWTMDTLAGPNITEKATVLALAQMTADDYIQEPYTEDWQDLHGPFNYSSSFGWTSDGLRGHIFADKTNSTIVVSIKGTTPALFDGYGTTTNDKENDNLFFSCCCGQGGSYLWRQVCDCQTAAYTANLTCIIDAMSAEHRYYRASIDLYTNVTKLYPNSNVWLAGHSLGGAVSSLLGLTFGIPVVTFEAVPEALPAARLGLPSPPGHDPRLPQTRQNTGAYHFGHTADPVYMGTCNGITSLCTWGGYAMESACHTGYMCTYDTVEDKGWSVGLANHRIKQVVSGVIKDYDDVPPCVAEEECYDCALWKFFRGNDTDTPPPTTTSTTNHPTWTRTEICKTPGWWSCLDESTTPPTTTSSTSITSTCKTPGWFGCNDPTTTTTTTTTTNTAAPAPSLTTTPQTTATTTTCTDPGYFFGCWDTYTTAPPTSTITSPTPTATSSTTCTEPGMFWGCWDTLTDGHTHSITPPPTLPPTNTASPVSPQQTSSCTHSILFGLFCLDWDMISST